MYSIYPAEFEDIIQYFKSFEEKYKNCIIGLSDHENGIDAASIGFMLGARIFEKHFTLDRFERYDHSFSLESQGLKR